VKLVVGLGNPGPRYAESRHNVGFRIVDHLAGLQGVAIDRQRFHGCYGEGLVPHPPEAAPGIIGERLGFLEPMTFMNRSGEAVGTALAELPEVEPARDLLVVYDDLDLPLGRIRVRPRGGAGGHNGLSDVISTLGTRDFARLRFGIGRPEAAESHQKAEGVIDFVLQGFQPDEQAILADRTAVAADAAATCLRDGPVAAMDRFNSFQIEG
jgi:PTH1 family peptidyl-tRNA hydrolase